MKFQIDLQRRCKSVTKGCNTVLVCSLKKMEWRGKAEKEMEKKLKKL
jgi:hypothetical protein